MHYQPNPELFNKIMAEIDREKTIIYFRRNILLSLSLAIITTAGVLIGMSLFLKEAKSSGLFDFIALGFSDFRVIPQNFNEFMLSIVQALPIDTLVVILCLLAGVMGSIHSLARSIYGFKIFQNNF